MVTDAQKRGNRKWDAQHLRNASCRLRVEEYEKFQEYCSSHGKTVSGVLLEYIRSCIDEAQD